MALSTLLWHYAKLWQQSLHMERTLGLQLRMPFSFPDIDRYGEALCGLLTGLKGSGTKGSGADGVAVECTIKGNEFTLLRKANLMPILNGHFDGGFDSR